MFNPSCGATPKASPRSNLAALLALTASFLLLGGVGSWLIYTGLKDLPNCSAHIARSRAMAFPVIMLVVHVVGYRLWRRQSKGSDLQGVDLTAYARPVKTALLQQGICLILALLMLDGGLAVNSTIIALLAYWMSVALVFAARPTAPTRGDLGFVRYGFPVIWIVALVVGPIVWHWYGLL